MEFGFIGLPSGCIRPYLCIVVRFCGDDPRLWDFQSDCVPILYLTTIRVTPSFCRKIGLFVSYLVTMILGPTHGIFFTKMYYLTDLRHFVS